MTITILSIYVITFLIIIGINLINSNIFKFIEITLNEPQPIQDELLSQFKLRKLKFIFNSFITIFFIFSSLYLLQNYLLVNYINSNIIHHILLIITFFAMFASVVALFATIAFIASWARTQFLGPNPKCDFQDIVSFHE